MGVIARIKTWVSEVLTYPDLNAEFDNVVNAINDIDNAKFSSDAADRLLSSKVSHSSMSLGDFLSAEHSSTGTHTVHATNNADNARIYPGSTATTQITVKADQLNLYSSATVASRTRKIVQGVSISNIDIT